MRAGERQPFGSVSVCGLDEPCLVVDGDPVPIDTDLLTLRWWDDGDTPWEVRASVDPPGSTDGRTTLRIIDDWRPAILRRAARVALDRVPVDLVTIGGDGREVRRVRVICLDLSTTGCRVAGAGPSPSDGDVFQLVATASVTSIRVDARVVHVAAVAFGGWHAGVEFLPHTPDERAMLVAWRDSVTGG
jgi:PilZ domain